MDNFHSKPNKRPLNSVDGMLPQSGKANTHAPQKSPLSRPRIGGDGSGRLLNDFGGSDGFRAASQPLLRGSEARQPVGRQPRRDINGLIDLSLPPGAAKPKKRRSWKSRGLRSFAGVMVAVLLVGGFLFGKGWLNLHNIFKGGAEGAAALQDGVDPSKLRGEGDGRVNILLLGRGGEGHQAPDLTDTILIASLDPIQKKAALLSIPRDLYTSTTSNKKINSVFAEAKYAAQSRNASEEDAENSGFDAIEKLLQENIGIPIHYHVMVDFAGFQQAINTVGGVDINVDAENTVYEVLFDHSTRRHYTLDVKQGQQHFDGQRALFYARSRYTSPRGDFDRTERQRLVMLALKEKVLSLGTFANPLKVSQLMDAFGNHVQANLSIGEVMRLYEIGKSINGNDVASVGLADPPNSYVRTDNINGMSIVRPRAGLDDYSEIQNYVRNALKDGFLAKENAVVAILNGTGTPGLATNKATELKSYGYNVSSVGDAPTKNYQKTILVDLTGGQKKYTRHYLEKRLGVTAVNSLPSGISNPSNADFVIILGQ